MKRIYLVLGGLAVVLALAAAGAATSFGSSGHGTAKAGTITIQSWLHATPSPYGLSATVDECFKISGAIVDKGGGPTWTDDDTYAAKANPASKCTAWEPVGGFVLVPPAAPATQHLSTLYATHTMQAGKGDIYITFAGAYNLSATTVEGVEPMSAVATWVITGGTGPYAKLRGHGSAQGLAKDIDASTWPYIFHTVRGQVYWAK
jgi:hypothetical protein